MSSKLQNMEQLLSRARYLVSNFSIQHFKTSDSWDVLKQLASIGKVCPESEFTDDLPRAPRGAGRPSFDITVNTLKIYQRCGFSIKKIAKIFCVSSKTIHRQIAIYKLKDEVKTYSTSQTQT